MWLNWIDRVHAGTEDAARSAVLHLSSDDVLSFWRWNDREAAISIDACPADEVADMVDSLRSALMSDVVSEVRYRASNKAGV